ncbi:MAG: hypothetical protein LBL07_15105 [Tannerella sp.]|jgi:hypothetical protein|nr:hypothetical protein [Tannerella sp.]
MKRYLIVTVFLLGSGYAAYAQEQTALEKAMKVMNVHMNLPSFLEASQNKVSESAPGWIYATEITEESPIPRIAQTYRYEPSYGDTYFKVLFGMLHSVIKYRDDDCYLLVSATGESGMELAEIIQENAGLFNIVNPSFNRIKRDIRYGEFGKSATEPEIDVLKTVIHYYPEERAQKLFHAAWMASYPVDMEGNVYKEKYTTCKAVVMANKKGVDMFLYFLMTDESATRFDKYLNALEKVFWFHE